MMENYLVKDFRRTAAQRFPAQAEQLNATFDARLRTLWEENAGESREKKEHLRAVWLSGALPVLLRQRRYQLAGLHPKLLWHRTKTLGRGDDCCDFCLKIRDHTDREID